MESFPKNWYSSMLVGFLAWCNKRGKESNNIEKKGIKKKNLVGAITVEGDKFVVGVFRAHALCS